MDCTHASKDEIVKRIISGLVGIRNKDIVMVGDRERDIRAANDIGIDSIAVTYGYGSIQELEGANPTYLAGTVDELRLLLSSNMNNKAKDGLSKR
jgi:phosphoglycolate phosphatase